jgi:hypothetical protein
VTCVCPYPWNMLGYFHVMYTCHTKSRYEDGLTGWTGSLHGQNGGTSGRPFRDDNMKSDHPPLMGVMGSMGK